jgi:periplasmic copper chaperone A
MTIRLLVAGALLAACAPASEGEVTAATLRLRGAYALPPFTDAPLAGFVRIINVGPVPDTLVAVASDIAERGLLHGSDSTVGGGMAHLTEIEVPRGDSVVLRPKGLHLMLEGLRTRPAVGDTVVVRLTFRRAGTVTLPLPVKSYEDLP